MRLFLLTELKSAEVSRYNNMGTGNIGSPTTLEQLVAGYEVIVIENLSLNHIELICGKRPIFYNPDITVQ